MARPFLHSHLWDFFGCLRCCQLDNRKKWRHLTPFLLTFLAFCLVSFFPISRFSTHRWQPFWQEKFFYVCLGNETTNIVNCFAQKVCSSYAGWVVCEGAVWVTRELKGKDSRGNRGSWGTVNQNGGFARNSDLQIFQSLSQSWPSAFSSWSWSLFAVLFLVKWFPFDRQDIFLWPFCAHLSWKFPFDYCLHCVLRLKDQHWANAQ